MYREAGLGSSPLGRIDEVGEEDEDARDGGTTSDYGKTIETASEADESRGSPMSDRTHPRTGEQRRSR